MMQHSSLTIVTLAVLTGSSVLCFAEGRPANNGTGGWHTTVTRSVPTVSVPADAGRSARTQTGSERGHALQGVASYYWQGERTASGEPFDKAAMTAAHPTLPFNSLVRVTDRASGSSVVVRINDRGPFKPGRVIDLSEGAAEAIGMKQRGLTPVELEVLPGPASPLGR